MSVVRVAPDHLELPLNPRELARLGAADDETEADHHAEQDAHMQKDLQGVGRHRVRYRGLRGVEWTPQ